MFKKSYVLSEQALNVLKRTEAKVLLMLFFDIRDRRTINSNLANNVPNSPQMNIHVNG